MYGAKYVLVSLPATFDIWLASPESDFLKGKFLWMNWDVDELKAQADEIEKTHNFSVEMVGYPFGGDVVPKSAWN